jgi:saccharopine dehydrogenase-like NADP-dependent oxidoreductase
MRFVVLGGAGDMGSQAVEDLADTPGVELVTIADRDYCRAEDLARRMTGAPALVDVKLIDAEQTEDLVGVLRGYDVAASALGPFYRYEARLARAAIEAGVDYASVCDDWSATDAVFELDGVAREAGRTVITGLGASPGLSNLAVSLLATEMDSLRQVDIYVYTPLEAGEGAALLRHLLFMFSGMVPVHQQGARKMIRAASVSRTVQFPRFGEMKVWNIGHPEPVTLPRSFQDLYSATVMLGLGPGSRLLVAMARLGLFDSPDRIERWATRLGSMTQADDTGTARGDCAVRVDVVGEREGVVVHEMICGVERMRTATGLSLSIGAQMLARRDLTAPVGGVYAPEACLSAAAFLEAMRAKGLGVYRDLAMSQVFESRSDARQ